MALFCLSFELSGIEPVSTAELRTTLTNKPNTQLLHMYMKPFRSAEWYSDSHFPMVKIPVLDISSSKTQRLTNCNVLKFGPVSEQGAETRFHKETAIFIGPT